MATGTKSNTSKRVAFNWAKLKKMWDEGKSYLEMAKALDSHYQPQGDDPLKPTRARCSIAMTKGIKLDGKRVFFKRRSKPNTESKPKAPATKQAKKPTTKAKKPTTQPKAQKPKLAKKPAKAVALIPSPDKTTPPPEA